MKLFTRFICKKRAVSPVIAVILLIGLAVAAVAAIFLVVLPLLQPTSRLELKGAFIDYDDAYTIAADEGVGYGTGTLSLSNAGTGEVKIVSLKVYYTTNAVSGNWTEIVDHDRLDITKDRPYIIETIAPDKDLYVGFPLPDENDDNTITYRLTVTTDDGKIIDTAGPEAVNVVETEMQLTKDRPDISFIGTLEKNSNNIRRTKSIYPTSVSDNSAIKKVTYEVATNSGFSNIVQTKDITDVGTGRYPWSWNTFNDSSEGLDNGTYYMKMTVYDYAGLSKSTYVNPGDEINFTIDNDYVKPRIADITGSSKTNGLDLAEVGTSFSVNATITDSGSKVSTVKEAYIHYKLNDLSTTYTPAQMTNPSGDTWEGNIPADFVDSTALQYNLTYYITAKDDDDNPETSASQDAGVLDTTKPNLYGHTPVTVVSDTLEGPSIELSINAEDNDTVDLVTLVWREGNDTGLLIPDSWQVENYIGQSGDSWTFTIPKENVTVDGIDYYFNATDPTGNANDGAAGSPYHITVYDELAPHVLAFDPQIASPTIPGQDVTVRVKVKDNDPSFSTERFIAETGTVRARYNIDGGGWSIYFTLDHSWGDSSLDPAPDAIWDGIITGDKFQQFTVVSIEVEAKDVKGQTSTIQTEVEVSEAGKPLFRVTGTANTTGTYDHQIEVSIKNYGDGDAEVYNMTVYLYDNTKFSYTGEPLLTQIDAAGTGGINPRWTNVSTPSEFPNGTERGLTNNISINKNDIATLTLTYANTSGGYFDVNDMTVGIKLGFSFAYRTSNDYSKQMKANTTITAYQTTTQIRYFRSDSHNVNGWGAYNLGTAQSIGVQTLNEQSPRFTYSLTVTWSVQIYIVHADSSRIPLTSGKSAQVARSSDGSGLQYNTWVLSSSRDLTTTDAIMVEVYMDIGTYSYDPITFITEQLNAEDLVASTWTIWYYTERYYNNQWNQRRTRGIFYWGDSSYNSRIEQFKITILAGGGGGGSGASELSLKAFSPSSRIDTTVKSISPLSALWEKLMVITQPTQPNSLMSKRF
ncbi:MAG: archaellin/type IV pilin N-terminal domain-containing protein [Promethearchaeota archaeon]